MLIRKGYLILVALIISSVCMAQEEEDKEVRKGFKKENLFTGGNLSLGLSGNTFQAGIIPMFGYNLTGWIDIGLAVNYNYTSYRDVNYPTNDKIRQHIYGGGAFLKIYPVRFLFLTVQPEHNWISQKYIFDNGSNPQKITVESNSVLVGGGYTTGRDKDVKNPFFYVSILVDIGGHDFSPYTDVNNNIIPIVRAGMQIPLFQGGDR